MLDAARQPHTAESQPQAHLVQRLCQRCSRRNPLRKARKTWQHKEPQKLYPAQNRCPAFWTYSHTCTVCGAA